MLIERCYLQGKAALKANDGLHDGNTGEEKELTDEQADVDVEQLKGKLEHRELLWIILSR